MSGENWINLVKPKKVELPDKTIDEVLAENQIARACFVYPFASYVTIPGTSYTNRKVFSIGLDADSDFEMREFWCTYHPSCRFVLEYWDEYNSGNPIDLESYLTRQIGENGVALFFENNETSTIFPAGSHATLTIECENTTDIVISAWMKGFKVFR